MRVDKLLEDKLFELKEEEYQSFLSKLIPTINKNTIIGVRVPKVKTLAKEIYKEISEKEVNQFLKILPHKYYEEYFFHIYYIDKLYKKDFDNSIILINNLLPYVDNWAICDTIKIKVFEKNKKDLIPHIKKWIKSKHTYTIRYAIDLLMSLYLDEDYSKEYLEMVSKVKSKEYYVNMMISWFYATALAKRWEDTVIYINEYKLDSFVHNMTIKKARESFRISDTRKEYLKKYIIKK
ncbi:MAG: DNA alkylation repair protein [Eubacteriales bacterium]|nr:DNA alkylation repair protein [Eubacteriales bacterium]